MKRNVVAIGMSLLLTMSMLTGCGGNSSEANTEAATEASEASVTESETDSQTTETETEDEAAGIEVEEHLLSVEIIVPSSYFESDEEEELTQESLDALAEENGSDISYTLNDNDTVTCKMSKAAQREMLDNMKQGMDDYFAECTDPDSDSAVASFKELAYNDDLSEITITVDPDQYGGFDSFYGFAFAMYGYYYQIFDGVPEDDCLVTVDFVDSDGNVLDELDSDTLFEAETEE